MVLALNIQGNEKLFYEYSAYFSLRGKVIIHILENTRWEKNENELESLEIVRKNFFRSVWWENIVA